MAVAAAFVVLALGTRWLRIVAVAAALFVVAIGAAVIADGGHWLSDVIAGWCLAIAWVSALCLIVGRMGEQGIGEFLRTRYLPRHRRRGIGSLSKPDRSPGERRTEATAEALRSGGGAVCVRACAPMPGRRRGRPSRRIGAPSRGPGADHGRCAYRS